eukprot:3326749-Rhodomonas_salina.1
MSRRTAAGSPGKLKMLRLKALPIPQPFSTTAGHSVVYVDSNLQSPPCPAKLATAGMRSGRKGREESAGWGDGGAGRLVRRHDLPETATRRKRASTSQSPETNAHAN